MRRAKAIVLAVIVLLAVGFGCWELVEHLSTPPSPTAPPPPVPVNAAAVKIANVPAIVPALGTVQSIDTVNVMPQVNGRIMAIYFKQGDEVAKGHPLFLIDPRPYQAALNQAQGQLAKDQATLAEARMDLARYRKLMAENSIASQTEQDQVYVAGQDEGTVKLDQANVATAELNLSYCHIDAPIAGRTGPLLVDLGNYVQAANSAQAASAMQAMSGAISAGATPLVTITRMRPIYISFSVPQTQLETIRENQAKGALTVEAYSQSGTPLAQGKLSLISNEVATTTGTVMLEGTFANQDELLWPNEIVSVRLTEFIRKNAITIPASAVMTGPNGPYVYVIGSGDKVSRVNVQVTATEANVAVIGKGLQAGEQVVTNGQYRLDNGVKVSVEAPAAAPAS